MTDAEKKELRKFENQLTYRGVFQSDWPRLKELRAKYLVERGLDPNDWELGARHLKLKFSNHI